MSFPRTPPFRIIVHGVRAVHYETVAAAAAGLTYSQSDVSVEEGFMYRVLICLAILGAAGASSAAAQDAKAQGEKVFAAQKCALCHSVAGKGNAKGALDEVGSTLSADDIRAWITDAHGMTAKTK